MNVLEKAMKDFAEARFGEECKRAIIKSFMYIDTAIGKLIALQIIQGIAIILLALSVLRQK